MFCKNCGESIGEGQSFCGECGAPVTVTDSVPAPETAPAAETPSAPQGGPGFQLSPPAATGVPFAATPPPPAAPPPPPPANVPGGQPTQGPAWQAPQAPVWQPPQNPRGPNSKSTGLIVGIVAAAVLILAGIGAGVYFGFFYGDGRETTGDGGTVTTRTTVSDASTSTTGATSTSTASSEATGSTTEGGNTTQTVPGLNTSTSGSGATVGRPSTTTTEDIYGPYLAISQALAEELTFHDQRMPQLATEINNTLPRVPEWVSDELDTMLDILSDLDRELAMLAVPVEYEASLSWLEDATAHMVARIQATILGIEAVRNTGNANSATSYFDTGRKERDAYRQSFEKYLAALPPD